MHGIDKISGEYVVEKMFFVRDNIIQLCKNCCMPVFGNDSANGSKTWRQKWRPISQDQGIGSHSANVSAYPPPVERINGVDHSCDIQIDGWWRFRKLCLSGKQQFRILQFESDDTHLFAAIYERAGKHSAQRSKTTSVGIGCTQKNDTFHDAKKTGEIFHRFSV